ncbi:ABC transporter permease [Roseateles sp. BYS180W]|uniref:ABC transporter permease n=1 Tax=Roseateles rivi TaxID=3299028 RepID=A0ABW7FX45_9BURK
MALIELRGVSRHYELGGSTVRALDAVDLDIEAGDYVAIMGASGSGKSTMMNLLGCLDVPSSGRFTLDGVDVGEMGPDELARLRREHFGFVFQRYHLLPYLDAVDNVALPAVYAGTLGEQRRARAQQLLQRLGLGERGGHRPNELSGGQQQRVSIARALMNGGRIILADEPTGALDTASGEALLQLLAQLHQDGHTIILVTHDPKVAEHAQRVVRLQDGRILSDQRRTPFAPAARAQLPAAAPLRRGLQALGRWALQARESLRSAVDALNGNRLRTLLSTLGISIGIAAVVSIVAISSAARDHIEKNLQGLFSGKLMVFSDDAKLPPGAKTRKFTPQDLHALGGLPGVRRIEVERSSQGSARVARKDATVSIQGNSERLSDKGLYEIVEGRVFTPTDQTGGAQTVVIDDTLRQKLFPNVAQVVGRTLLLETTQLPNPRTGQVSAIGLPVTVIGVVKSISDSSISFGGDSPVYVPMSTYLRKFNADLDAYFFTVILDNKQSPQAMEQQVRYRLRALHGQEDFRIWNAQKEFEKIQSVTGALAAMLAGVAAIALLVGGVGVMNIMLVSVSERTREIGIRMAIGARQSDVRLQFLIEAVLLCLLGGLLGLGLSWLIVLGIGAAQEQLKPTLSLQAVLVASAVACAIGLLFGTLPARRAARLSPVDALARE